MTYQVSYLNDRNTRVNTKVNNMPDANRIMIHFMRQALVVHTFSDRLVEMFYLIILI
jgi:hypothetical protein